MAKLTLTLVTALVAATGKPAKQQASAKQLVGQKAPPFKTKTLSGKRFALRRHLGADAPEPHTALVLIFVDPTVEDCRKEVNQLEKLHKEWEDVGVRFVHIGFRRGRRMLRRFMRKQAIPWTILPDRKGRIAKRYGVDGVPFLSIISGSSGEVTHVSKEFSPRRYEDLREALSEASGKSPPWGSGTETRSAILNYDERYTFARPPSAPGASTRWQPLAMFIGRVANAYISMQGSETYAEFGRKLKAGQYELVNAGPLMAAQVLDRYEPLVTLERREQKTYRGIIFARRDAGIKRLRGLRDKTLAMVSQHSSSGGAYPFAKLLRANLKPEKQVNILWAGSHQAVARAVAEGRAVAGACYQDCRDHVWKTRRKKRRATRIIARTSPIPNEMILARRDLSEESKKAIVKALLGVNARDIIMRHINSNEAPITGVSRAQEKVLRRTRRKLDGIPAAMRKAIALDGENGKP